MGRAHVIKIGGRVLDPKDATNLKLACDTPLACPNCNSSNGVGASPALVDQLVAKARNSPRLQDRRCFACGHRWTAVLPPESFAQHFP